VWPEAYIRNQPRLSDAIGFLYDTKQSEGGGFILIHGNTEGISKQTIERLESLNDMTVPRENFFSREMLELLAAVTGQINREISVYLNRRGEVLDVSVGELNQVSLPYMNFRRSSVRLSGVRCIHTHPGGSGMLSRVDLNSLSALRFDAIAALGVRDGAFSESYAAVLNPPGEEREHTLFGPLTIEALCGEGLITEIRYRDVLIGAPDTVEVLEGEEERAVLIGLDAHGEGAVSIDELGELARTAGATVLDRVLQSKRMPEPATYIGRGKAQELALLCQGLGANLAIFDDELSAVQIKNLEEILGVKVIDRTALILDIFSRHAKSREGKLQVELAQLKYRLPRLQGLGLALSRLGGGIGTRGPGEKKLETDRRHIHRRIHEIEEELKKVKEHRDSLRVRRQKEGIPICALVGYTNTGKSTLLNALTGSSVLVENKLFATLDPVSRGLVLPNNQEIRLIDTVGFIDKLPHDLVEAFHSTLEEVTAADLLLHVVDASSPVLNEHIMVVRRVLDMLGANQPVITVFNKMDRVESAELLPSLKPEVHISAIKGDGLDRLALLIQENLPVRTKRLKLLVPYDQGGIRSMVHSKGKVFSEDFVPEGVAMEVEVDDVLDARLKNYIISD